jgi:hypothetical protein
VRVASQQILDEFSSCGLFSAHHFSARLGVPLGERGHRVVHDMQYGLSGRTDSRSVSLTNDRWEICPDPPRRREREIDASPYWYPLLSCLAALASYDVNLSRIGDLAERRGVGKHRQVVAQQRHRHPAGVPARMVTCPYEPIHVRPVGLTLRVAGNAFGD